jgi:hypothetical protein
MTRTHARTPALAAALAAAFALGACAHPMAQVAPAPIASDRPSYSTGTAITPVGFPLLETGLTYYRADGVNLLAVGEATLRVGVAPRAELRLTAPNYNMVRPDPFRADGLGDAGAGVKVTLKEGPAEAGTFEPGLALLAGVSLPTGSQAFTGDQVLPSASFIAGWSLTDRVGLTANLIWAQARSGGGTVDTYAAVGGVSFSHTDKFGSFYEVFSTRGPSGNWDDPYLTGGVTYLLTPRFQLDAHWGFRTSGPGDAYYLGTGFSRRF